jgi:hypothetical protein
MRFITEFELPQGYDKSNEVWKSFNIERKKTNVEAGLGIWIANKFGWQNPVNENDLHYKLEIEAFPMDKWVEFKKKLASKFVNDSYAGDGASEIFELIKELESYGEKEHDNG